MVEDTQKRYADDVTLQELVRLRVENERLREALQLIALGDEFGITKQGFANLIAKNALQQKESE